MVKNIAAEETDKLRIIITTDIGGDPDDAQSMIRFLCYSNMFDVEGLIATCLHKKHIERYGKPPVNPNLIKERVEAYGQVLDNLKKHANGFPSSEYLLSIIKSGYPSREKVGAGYDTEASEWIIKCIDKEDPRTLNFAIWGGAVDLAQAIHKVKYTRSQEQFDKFISKIRIYCINKQDIGVDSILSNAPDILMYLAYDKSSTGKKVYLGMYQGGDDMQELTSSDWVVPNVQTNHGLLGALYPLKTNTFNGINCLKEGDTPSFLFFVSHVIGLSNCAHPNWGSWGGRFIHHSNNLWLDAKDTVVTSEGVVTDEKATVWRWRKEFQNDFAARMDWCVAEKYTDANHNPVVVVNGALERTVSSGETVVLDATGSFDPDDDTLSYEWMYYKEAGTYGEDFEVSNANKKIASFVAPLVLTPKTLHFILKVTDNGSPRLTGYKRVIVTVVSC